ncbi:GNAT family N-acetyltransferase [Paenibacillus mucilaginosus]|uniref:GCN5 family acetyltransferase n=2 Tax=Paenibacillus mucilaginosus TaxID=61624 RepID=I0BQX9_9BACL|nr:GNAT family N-acetyltransferase [Paenibacillus mucilaginosus]AEI44683.1 YqkA [Paenibacillus mucilaginosus KNP414]AFH64776.1 GCN5 family acetyltransferase [Paenibacillus mucilaginosus K02]MCG7215611.1 GNAT family N-acetyltransferase [Paenibacillus mucilaginosus]WDM26239.1 GNAT family N-acetyltransferase [Paenibacillus mucilaginosus]
MIVRLDLTDPETARNLLKVQIPSYLVEAELIGFHGIPALNDTVESLAQSGETFYGYFAGGELAGAAAYELDGGTMEITRLVVHPKFFRRGIGGSLIRFLLELNLGVKGYRVSTGAKNGPAKRLYTNCGFKEAGELEVAPEVFLTLLERGGAGQ